MENNKKFISLANLAKFKELLQSKIDAELAKKLDASEKYDDTELRGRIEELEKFELPENLVVDANYVHTDNNYDAAAVAEVAKIANKADTSYVNDELAKKVDKEGYIAFTQGEKDKLAGLENYDDTALAARVKTLEDNPYELPSDVVQDANYSTRMSAVEAGVAGIDGKVAAGVAEAKGFTYSKDEIDTKVQGAKDYADGKANTAESNAKTYAAEQVSALKTELLGPGATEAMDTIAELAKALEGHADEYDALLEVVGKKANASDVYTKEEADGKFLTGTDIQGLVHENDIQDVVRDSDITDVVRTSDIADMATTYDLENYLPLSGGTLTGDVKLSQGTTIIGDGYSNAWTTNILEWSNMDLIIGSNGTTEVNSPVNTIVKGANVEIRAGEQDDHNLYGHIDLYGIVQVNGNNVATDEDLQDYVLSSEISDVVREGQITDVVRTSDIVYAEESDIISLFN